MEEDTPVLNRLATLSKSGSILPWRWTTLRKPRRLTPVFNTDFRDPLQVVLTDQVLVDSRNNPIGYLDDVTAIDTDLVVSACNYLPLLIDRAVILNDLRNRFQNGVNTAAMIAEMSQLRARVFALEQSVRRLTMDLEEKKGGNDEG